MAICFGVKDVSGRTIYLSDERWKHILSKHKYLINQIEQIKETLENLDTIVKSKFDINVRHYYKHYKYKSQCLLVSIKYLNGKGFIITSFYRNNIK